MTDLQRTLADYADGALDSRGLEDWLVANLQVAIDSEDAEAIAIMGELDAMLISLGEGLVDESDLVKSAVAFLSQVETQELAMASTDGGPEITTDTTSETDHLRALIPTPTAADLHLAAWRVSA